MSLSRFQPSRIPKRDFLFLRMQSNCGKAALNFMLPTPSPRGLKCPSIYSIPILKRSIATASWWRAMAIAIRAIKFPFCSPGSRVNHKPFSRRSLIHNRGFLSPHFELAMSENFSIPLDFRICSRHEHLVFSLPWRTRPARPTQIFGQG